MFISEMVQDSDFDKLLDAQGIAVIWHFFPKLVTTPFLAAILKFCVKRIYLRNGVR